MNVILFTGGDGMITRRELAEKLNVSERTIDRYREKGMPHIKLESLVRFDEEEVMNWLKGGK